MVTVTNNIKKQLTITNEIKIDDTVVKGQQATISSDGRDITFSDWCNNMTLYKEHRDEIRKKEAEFEDLAFTEQDKMINALSTTHDGGTK